MNVRSAAAAAGLLLLVASSGCRAPRRETKDFSSRAPGKEECHRDSDCSWLFRCTSDHRCECQVDGDCAASQRCVATYVGGAGVCRYR